MTRAKTLKDVINYGTAPLVQWEPAIGETLSEGKAHEDMLTHGAVAITLEHLKAKAVTGIIADESRLEIAVAEMAPSVQKLTHLTLPGTFEKAARHTLDTARQNSIPRIDRVRVTSMIRDIRKKSQDAVVMNMIFGCLATETDHKNLQSILCFAASLLKPNGSLLMVRPNPAGGAFSTYRCATPADALEGGKDYDFIVNGLEEYGEMKNLYTPDDFLKAHMKAAGFHCSVTQDIMDRTLGAQKASEKPAFLLNICPKIK